MNLRRIKHMFLRLSPEERMAGIGAILVLVGAFLPWYSVVFSFNEKGVTESGFTGDLGVVGFVVFLLTLLSLAFLMGSHLNFKLPHFGFHKDKIILFLLGESAFLLLLTIAIYTKRSFEYTNAELRFGLYLALIGAFIGTFAAFAQIQKKQKKDVEEFFSHPEEAEVETEETAGEDITDPELVSGEEPVEDKSRYFPEVKKEEPTPKPAEQKSFFYEEPPPQPEVAEESAAADEEEPMEPEMIQEEPVAEEETLQPETIENEEIIEDEMPAAEAVSSEETEELELESYEDTIEATEKIDEEVSLDSPSDQGDYFTREAGVENKPRIKVDMDSIRRVDKETPTEPQEESEEVKESSSEGGGFYDDL